MKPVNLTKERQDQLIKEWVGALRSGKYKQGTKFLKTDDEYCCLGVLKEVVLKKEIPTGQQTLYHSDMEEIGLTTTKGSMYIGFDNPLSLRSGYYDSLANLNDNGCPFNKIADIIESRPKGLFELK